MSQSDADAFLEYLCSAENISDTLTALRQLEENDVWKLFELRLKELSQPGSYNAMSLGDFISREQRLMKATLAQDILQWPDAIREAVNEPKGEIKYDT